MESNIIPFTLFIDRYEFRIQASRNTYQSLMTLIADRFYLAEFGLCCGMGSCGTCEVVINGRKTLACETAVDDSLTHCRVVVDKLVMDIYPSNA